ncbi:hypothetical protein T492DRAFT_839742 [Pavlovales sp. CCMP2436]|nr:hypothetical protein T492DRAFT_839742 [Pavlovales sp. CCMP2436]
MLPVGGGPLSPRGPLSPLRHRAQATPRAAAPGVDGKENSTAAPLEKPDIVRLPGGWVSLVEANTGSIYYYQAASARTSWDPPPGVLSDLAAAQKPVSFDEQPPSQSPNDFSKREPQPIATAIIALARQQGTAQRSTARAVEPLLARALSAVAVVTGSVSTVRVAPTDEGATSPENGNGASAGAFGGIFCDTGNQGSDTGNRRGNPGNRGENPAVEGMLLWRRRALLLALALSLGCALGRALYYQPCM